MKHKIKINFALFIVLGVLSYMTLGSYYMTHTNMSVTVLDKLQSGGKHSDFYVVYRLNEPLVGAGVSVPEGYVFDQIVSAATYSRVMINNDYTINTRPFDVRQTAMMNVLCFFGGVVSLTLGLAAFASFIYNVVQRLRGKQ